MKNVYITGDRQMDSFAAAKIVNTVLKQVITETNGDLAVGTGTCAYGVERAVRFLVPDEACNIAPYSQDGDGTIDFEQAFALLEPSTDLVVFIHMDPLSSHIGKALAATFPPEKIRMLLQEAELAL